jgi:hypothetical protein
MANRVAKNRNRTRFVTMPKVDGDDWCRTFSHIPRQYGDGISCQNCGKTMTQAELEAYEKANPKKTFHKRYKNIGYGGVETWDTFAQNFGVKLKEGVK